jgi:hypothetical protein
MEGITRETAARWLAVAGTAALMIGTPGYPVNVDEPWIGEWAWFLGSEGVVRSELFDGYHSYEQEVLVYHRLVTWAGAGVTQAFGFGLPQLRAISVSCSLILLGLLCLPSRGVGASAGPAAILLLMPVFFRFARIYRPEAMLALLGWICWMAADLGVRRRSIAAAAASGAAAGLALLTHLDGAAFAAAGLATFASRRMWPAAAAFGLAAAAVAAPSALHVLQEQSLFESQFSGALVATKTSFGPLTPLLNILTEHERLFREPGIILVTLCTGWALVSGGLAGRRAACPWFYTFAGCAALSLAAISSSKAVKYGIPILPFAASEIWLALEAGGRPAWRTAATRVLTAMLVCWGIAGAVRVTLEPREHPEIENAAAGSMIPDGAACVAPIGFVFDEIGRVTIHSLYLARMEGVGTLDSEGLATFARSRGAGYAVIDPYWREAMTGPMDPADWECAGSSPGGTEVYRLRRRPGI